MPPRKRLGQLLTELKVIDEAQLQSALGHQKQWGGKIGAILVEKGFCSEDQLVGAVGPRLPPLRVAPPVATPVEPLRPLEPPRPAPYVPPPVPQNATPLAGALDEIEAEVPAEGDGQSAHGFDAEQERMRQQF